MKKIICKITFPDSYTESDMQNILYEINENFINKNGIIIEKLEQPDDLDIDYVGNWLGDVDENSIRFSWRIDEEQKNTFHHFFSKIKLFQIINNMVDYFRK